MAGERFSAELWSAIEEIYQAILEHPFLTGLADGSLERESLSSARCTRASSPSSV
jgi:thiaminase/transcriptional activator TenA